MTYDVQRYMPRQDGSFDEVMYRTRNGTFVLAADAEAHERKLLDRCIEEVEGAYHALLGLRALLEQP